jgi:hypothetical protein
MFFNQLDDVAFRNAVNTARLTREERNFVTSWLNYNWLALDAYAIEDCIEEMQEFAMDHPNSISVLNLMITALRRYVIPRVSNNVPVYYRR